VIERPSQSRTRILADIGMASTKATRVLLTGASGYVGGRLMRVLHEQQRPLRCLARNPDYLRSHAPAQVEVVGGDVMDPASLRRALSGIDAAYYLVHALGAPRGFEALEERGAAHFAEAAREARVQRIIYLGGLGDDTEDLSPHLRSRQRVGAILRESGVPTIEFRASIVVGSGSASFEMIRALVERLPVMVTPRWVAAKAQPIAITDLLDYLVAGLDRPGAGNPIVEIGGADQVSYGDLMREYAQQRGLRRIMIPVPVLSPRLSSLWLGLVTPLYARVGRKLIESLRHETVVRCPEPSRAFGVRPRGMRQAIAEALLNEDREFAQTRWSDALSSSGPPQRWGGVRFGNRLVDMRERKVSVPVRAAFRPIQRMGGRAGWYYANWLWKVRGFMDLLVGGIGLRRGRPDPEQLHVGDALDWWRVESYKPDSQLRLIAEMRLPGRGWLEFDVRADPDGSVIRQTATFDPVGLFGLAYWYLIYPIHHWVFQGMLRGICREAEKAAAAEAEIADTRRGSLELARTPDPADSPHASSTEPRW